MALASQQVVSDGTLALLNISIDYLDRANITVYYNGVINTTNWSWVGTTAKQIQFSPNVPNGTVVLVQRLTVATAIRNIYATGAQFISSTMDDNFKQLLLLSQEARENSSAYGIAVANGFVGTQAQWLASLVGPASTVPGPAGPANTLTIGTVTTGVSAASITGTAPNQILNLVLAQGPQGPQGPQGIPGTNGTNGTNGSGTSVIAKDEGTTLTTGMTSVNFVGAGVTATTSGSDVTVTIPGGGGGSDPTTEQLFWFGQ